MLDLPLLPEGVPESVAVGLLRHIEWQSDSFSVVFLFADVGPAMALADWTQRRLPVADACLMRQEAPDSFAVDPEGWLNGWLGQLEHVVQGTAAVWLALQRHPADKHWNQARLLFLARLNERRFILERDLHCPLVLLLPISFKTQAKRAAPDLWHVRAFSHELPAVRKSRLPVGLDSGYAGGVRAVADAVHGPSQVDDEQEPDAPFFELNPFAGFIPAAWAKVKDLLAHGRPADAMAYAYQILQAARLRLQHTTPESVAHLAALRTVSTSLDIVGEVAGVQGDWSCAQAAYEESLEIRRRLVEQLDGLPQALREMSVSLNNLGEVAQTQGDWEGALAVYQKSLEIRRQLVERLSRTPQSLRDVSVSLERVGAAVQVQGDWEGARAMYQESLDISRQLVDRLGRTPQSLRDVSVALNKVGEVAQVQGDWVSAQVVYWESLEIRRQLVDRLGGIPQSLRDVSMALNNVGEVAQAQGDWESAEAVYRESLEISRQLVERLGGTPESLDDLAIALIRNGLVPEAPSELFSEAESIYARLVRDHPQVKRYASNLAWVRNALAERSP